MPGVGVQRACKVDTAPLSPAFSLSITQRISAVWGPCFGCLLPWMVGKDWLARGQIQPLVIWVILGELSFLLLSLSPPYVPPPSPTVTLCSVPGSCQAILHPDTNEKIFMPFRMSGKPLGPSASAQLEPITMVTAPGTSRCAVRGGDGACYKHGHTYICMFILAQLGSLARPQNHLWSF